MNFFKPLDIDTIVLGATMGTTIYELKYILC